MFLTILNYLSLFADHFLWFITLFIVCRCKVLQSIILRISFGYKKFALTYHCCPRCFRRGFSISFYSHPILVILKDQCLVRPNLFMDITQTCVHRTLANCRAKPGIFASSYYAIIIQDCNEYSIVRCIVLFRKAKGL